MEGTYNNYLVRLPHHLRADWKLKLIIKNIAQMPLKHGQAWSVDHLPKKPVPVLILLVKKCFLMTSHKFKPPPGAALPTHKSPTTGYLGEVMSSENCGGEWGHSSASFSANWTSSNFPSSLHWAFPPTLLFTTSSGLNKGPSHPWISGPWPTACCEAASAVSTVW